MIHKFHVFKLQHGRAKMEKKQEVKYRMNTKTSINRGVAVPITMAMQFHNLLNGETKQSGSWALKEVNTTVTSAYVHRDGAAFTETKIQCCLGLSFKLKIGITYGVNYTIKLYRVTYNNQNVIWCNLQQSHEVEKYLPKRRLAKSVVIVFAVVLVTKYNLYTCFLQLAVMILLQNISLTFLEGSWLVSSSQEAIPVDTW